MKIITISREFGSGGRELGKRMAEVLGFDYYDRELITTIARQRGLDEQYVEHILDNHGWRTIPMTFRHSFSGVYPMQTPHMDVLLEQKRVMEDIAALGKDFIIVGRNADILLSKYLPFNIFVCSDTESKVQRCLERAEGEKPSRREIKKNMRSIDKNRALTREILSDTRWGLPQTYHLTVNTSGWVMHDLAPVVSEFALRWFERHE